MRDCCLQSLDRTYKQPKSLFSMMMVTPLFHSSPHFFVMGRLFSLLLEDEINEIAYHADVAGLSYSSSSTAKGFSVCICLLFSLLILSSFRSMDTMKSFHSTWKLSLIR